MNIEQVNSKMVQLVEFLQEEICQQVHESKRKVPGLAI